MTNAEAIETLKNLGYLLRSFAHFYEKINPSKTCDKWKEIASLDIAISALENDVGKNIIGVKVDGKDRGERE